jgi:hypothetical protein
MHIRALALLCLFVSLPSPAQHGAGHDPDDGTLSSALPRIPEPLVFDLIRPLGAKKGEFEVNSLFRFQPNSPQRALLWAPEVEYAFLDGYGVEFELPMENQQIDTYKFALQGTLPGPMPRQFIHGWQAIGEIGHRSPFRQADFLYLAGARFHRKWSGFTMTGLRAESGHRRANAFLGNYSIFHHRSKHLTLGLESNIKGRAASERGVLLMPQVHLRGNRVNIQFGAGWNHAPGRRSGPQLALRVSREF